MDLDSFGQSANTETPLVQGDKPILVAYVWEQAYYLDDQNRRPDFLQVGRRPFSWWPFLRQMKGSL